MEDLVPVVLSGGSGTRLWPISRALRPKQFLDLAGDGSLFQATLQRLSGICGPGIPAPVIVANKEHRFLVGEQCREVDVDPLSIILEPCGRNTAPAIALGALAAQQGLGPGRDPVVLVLPSDHVIRDVATFQDAVRRGYEAAALGKLVTFGIVPTRPETGYGYVRVNAFEPGSQRQEVAAFVEKPRLELAEAYVKDGHHYWNSGMFMFRASVVLDQLHAYRPDIAAAAAGAWHGATRDLEFVRPDASLFEASPSDSIDYAVMEKTDNAVLIPLDAGWSDVGAWDAVSQIQPKDALGNGSRGKVILEGVTNSYVHASERLIAVVGLDNVVVVETSDAVLVVCKDKTQDVKKVVDKLKASGATEVEHHREVFRPWGSYDSVDNGKRFQVKRITVKQGAKLSVQMHHHRAEHWVVVSGTARVQVGDTKKLVTENESIYIPAGVVHSLENPGKVPLHLIEVQSGSYLGEDDIVRFEDLYGRAG